MQLQQLLAGVATYGENPEITALVCDSRKVTAGCLFVCIDGVSVDAHRFAADALAAGAAAVMVERDLGLEHQIRVNNTREAWALLSANWFGHPASRLNIIGITGTNGKTSTTYMLKQMLEACGHKVGLIGTIQNLIGQRVVSSSATTPAAYELQQLFAEMADEGCDYVVMEVSSHALHQRRVAGVTFAAGVFTNLTQDHLDYHHTMEEYCDAKKLLFAQSECAVVQAKDAWVDRLTDGLTCPVYRFCIGEKADFTAENLRYRPDGSNFTVCAGNRRAEVSLSMPGEFSVNNALGAIAAAVAVGLPFDTVCEAISQVTGVNGRAEIVPTGRDFTVVVDYAHTPDGLEKICRTLQLGLRGRLITVFGCTGDRDRTKRPIMGEIAARLSDLLVLTSDNPGSEEPMDIIEEVLPGIPDGTPMVILPDREQAVRWAIEHAQAGDTVLLAGKGHETYQILKNRTVELDERKIVAEVLAGKKD